MICVRQVHEVDRGTGECSGRVLAGECSRASALRGRESARAYVEASGVNDFVLCENPDSDVALLEARLGRYTSVTSWLPIAFRIQWNLLET